MHLAAMLQDFPIHKCTALVRARIGLLRAEIRREVLIVHFGRKVMIVEDTWLEISPIDRMQSRFDTFHIIKYNRSQILP